VLLHVSAASTNLSPMDQLCCGNTGRIALLTYAADVLAEPAWRVAASRIARQMVDRAAARGSFAVTPVDDVFSPGQYHGLAGIGHELLRLEHSDVPSVLLWQ
jgi:lantibiotic modifying enzyme